MISPSQCTAQGFFYVFGVKVGNFEKPPKTFENPPKTFKKTPKPFEKLITK